MRQPPKVKKKRKTIVEITDNSLRIVLGAGQGGEFVAENVEFREFKENSDAEIAKTISNFFSENHISPRKAVFIVASQYFLTKNIDMPSNDPDEIKKIIDLQAGRLTPYSREEIVIDYYSASSETQHYTNVFLVIIQRKIAQRLMAIADQAHVEIERLGVASEAAGNEFFQGAGSAATIGSVGGIHMLHDSTELSVADKKQVIFVRHIAIGSHQLSTKDETLVTQFVDELEKSIQAYQGQGLGKPIRSLILAGQAANPDMEALIKSKVPYVMTSGLDVKSLPESLFSLSAGALNRIKQYQSTSFFDLLSFSCHLDSTKLDLTPYEVKYKKTLREGGRNLLTLGFLIMTLLLTFSFFLGIKIYLKRIEIDKLESMNDQTFEEAQTLEQVSTKSRLLRNLLENRGKSIYVFEKLTSMIGGDISMSAFSYNSENIVKMSGTAESMSRVFAFVTELEESAYFKDVKTTQTKTRRQGAKELADFDIECTFEQSVEPTK